MWMNATHRSARLVAFLAALMLGGGPLRVEAAPEAVDLDAVTAHAESLHGDYRALAEYLDDSLRTIPEGHEVRFRRNLLMTQAANAYRLASEDPSSRCDLLNAGLSLTSRYLAELLSVYGVPAEQSDEYLGMTEIQAELKQAHQENECPEPATPSPVATTPPPTTTFPDRHIDVEPIPPTTSRKTLRLRSAVTATGVLTVALLMTSLGTGLSRYHDPNGGFTGASYQAIINAARDTYLDATPGNEVNYDEDTDMCQRAKVVDASNVLDACHRWEQLGAAAIATGILTGLIGATTLGLGIAYRRSKQRDTAARTALRTLSVAPDVHGGVSLGLRLKF